MLNLADGVVRAAVLLASETRGCSDSVATASMPLIIANCKPHFPVHQSIKSLDPKYAKYGQKTTQTWGSGYTDEAILLSTSICN